jgi:phosphohistidine phosphatase
MKTLILVRHAKSSWGDIGEKDIDRPLNDRGKKDAPEMAKRLKEKGIEIDLFVTSPAKRARKTAKLFAAEYKFKADDILIIEELYEPGADDFLSAISKLPDDKKVVALFSHNPGITQFANSLSIVRVDDMPTCGCFGFAMDAASWKDFQDAEKDFLFFDYPKNPIGS